MVDYVRPVTWKKPDVISIHVGMNDLTNGANMENRKIVREIVSVIQEIDSVRL